MPGGGSTSDGIIPPSERHAIDVTSQHGEVTVVLGLLRDDDPHFVIDVGAHDGQSLSNSWPFIRLGWRAIMVEPLSKPFAQLTDRYAGNPNVICTNKACAERPGRRKLYVGSDGDAGQMSTLCEDEALREHRTAAFEEVRVDTLTNILTIHKAPEEPSLLAIDTEGMDYEVLCGLDFAAFHPRIIISEEYPQNQAKHNKKYQLLRERGYSLHGQFGCNTIWVRPELRPLTQ